MFGKRYDGRRVHDIEPFDRIIPYLMKTRTDSMNMFEDTIACETLDAYMKEKAEQGRKITYMHILIAAVVRVIALRPRLNRFVINRKIYARPKIWVSFVVHPTLQDGSTETTIKLCFEGTESIFEICDIIDEAIERETTKRTESNSTDKLAKLIMSIPDPLIRLVVNTLMFLDRHNMMPKAVIEASPFHTTFFLTNLKSLGINHVYHHVYEFGTTGLFIAMGKEKTIPVFKKDEVIPQKNLGFSLVCDERFCDGLYFALSLRMLKKILANPACLEKPLDKKVEDVK